MGYKRRNGRLDELTANPPKYVANMKTSLLHETFEDVQNEKALQ